MTTQRGEEAGQLVTFGRRKVRPRVCIVDNKQHVRTFLGETLEDLGFITCECAQVGELGEVLDRRLPVAPAGGSKRPAPTLARVPAKWPNTVGEAGELIASAPRLAPSLGRGSPCTKNG